MKFMVTVRLALLNCFSLFRYLLLHPKLQRAQLERVVRPRRRAFCLSWDSLAVQRDRLNLMLRVSPINVRGIRFELRVLKTNTIGARVTLGRHKLSVMV